MKYYQCKLLGTNGTTRNDGWIEERAAKVGNTIEIKESGWFTVEAVYQPGIEYRVLLDKQARDRNCLPSIAA